MKQIDARGQQCPKPLILTKSALTDETIEEAFVILIDNETSKENVERFLADNNVKCTISQEADTFFITVTKSNDGQIISEPSLYCPLPIDKSGKSDHLICFRGTLMGSGSEELGNILISGFINTIKETTPLPAEIVFYNSGVELVTDESPHLPAFKELEDMGIKFTICGTCADYFGIKNKISIGTISNMYDILNALSNCSRIIYP